MSDTEQRPECPPGCTVDYPHRHLDPLERLDFDDKVCGCGQASCRDSRPGGKR